MNHYEGLAAVCHLIGSVVSSHERMEGSRLECDATMAQCRRDVRVAELQLAQVRKQCKTFMAYLTMSHEDAMARRELVNRQLGNADGLVQDLYRRVIALSEAGQLDTPNGHRLLGLLDKLWDVVLDLTRQANTPLLLEAPGSSPRRAIG